MANILELDSVKEYLVNHGGKVKNHDLVTHFKGYLNDPENKNLNRETFKECVNKLASVKSEDGDKMIILKKKYRQASPPKIDENVNPEPNESDISDGGQSSKMASKEGSAEASNDVSSSISSTPERSRESSVGAQADVSRESSVSMEEAGVHEVSPIVSVKDRAVFLNKSIQIVDEDEKDEPSVQMRKKTKVEKTSRQSEDDPGLLNMTDPKEREWMVTSAKSDYQAMARMLLDFPNLAAKKELTSGYTPLHWACKHGEKDVVKLLAGKHKVPTDPRSHGGYTPLHMAALHGHEDLIELLVQTYEADVNIRDYSGKKPKHYLKISAQAHTQHLLQPAKRSETSALAELVMPVTKPKTPTTPGPRTPTSLFIPKLLSRRGSSEKSLNSNKSSKKKLEKQRPASEQPSMAKVNSDPDLKKSFFI